MVVCPPPLNHFFCQIVMQQLLTVNNVRIFIFTSRSESKLRYQNGNYFFVLSLYIVIDFCVCVMIDTWLLIGIY